MKKLQILIFLLFCGHALLVPAQDMRALFLDAPDEMFPLLTKNCRADMVDYIDAGMKARVTNRLDGTSVLESLSEDYLLLASTASSTIQMKLLPHGDGTIICVVRTVKAEAADSRIEFYDILWNRLYEIPMFTFPSIKEFFVSPADAGKHIAKCDIYLVSLMLNANDNTLVAEYTMPAYMNIEDAAEVKPLLRKLVYRWNGHRFVNE